MRASLVNRTALSATTFRRPRLLIVFPVYYKQLERCLPEVYGLISSATVLLLSLIPEKSDGTAGGVMGGRLSLF